MSRGPEAAFAAQRRKARMNDAQANLDYARSLTNGAVMKEAPPTAQQRVGDWLTAVFDPILEWSTKGKEAAAAHRQQLDSPDAWAMSGDPQVAAAMGFNEPASYAGLYEDTLKNAKLASAGDQPFWYDTGSTVPVPRLAALGAIGDTAEVVAPFIGPFKRGIKATAEIPGELAQNMAEASVKGVSNLVPVSKPERVLRPLRTEGQQVVDRLKADADQVQLALPDPAAKQLEDEAKRAQKWAQLERARANAGVKRNKETGQYAGAPAGIDTPQKVGGIVRRYAGHTQQALDAGIEPGYFYEQGRQAIRDYAEEPGVFARLMEPTSTETSPLENVGHVLKALDQAAMGHNIKTGMYSNKIGREVENELAGDRPFHGYKTERYGNLLGADRGTDSPLAMEAPKDRWEGYDVGYRNKQGGAKSPSGSAQVAFTDMIEQRARAAINKRREAEGLPPLTPEENQELHWAAVRFNNSARSTGDKLELGPRDTLQDTFPQYEMQHSWEAEPGRMSGMQHTLPKDEYMQAVRDVAIDEQGKDRFLRAMGAQTQAPAISGPGVFEGNVSPGMQSRSHVAYTQREGINPASAKRVDATEAARMYMLGQDARAGHIFRAGGQPGKMNAAQYSGELSSDRALQIQNRLDDEFGAGKAAVVPTDSGYRVLSLDEANKGAKFKQRLTDLNLGDQPTFGRKEDIFSGREEGQGGATRNLLAAVEDPMSPGAARLAESPQTRELAGQMADLYGKLEAEGKLTGSQSLQRALQTWKTQGLAGLRELVAKGLAPAALLALLGTTEPDTPYSQQQI